MSVDNFKKATKFLFLTLPVFLLVFILFGGRFDFNNSKKISAQTQVIGQGTPHFLSKWIINVPTPTLSVFLLANPSSGSQPLNVALTADVSGTAEGTINYTFWWNCNSVCGTVASCSAACGDPWNSANGAKFDGVFDDPKTFNHTYSTGGTLIPKVIVERSTAPAVMKTASVTVGCNALCSSWTACSSACGGGTQSCTDISSCEYGRPPRVCNPPFFSLKNSNNIYANIIKNSVNSVTSTKTTISTDTYYCYNKQINLSETSSPALPAGTTFNYTITLTSANGYTTDLTITVPATTPAGIYTINITGIDSDGYNDNSPIPITFTVNLKDPSYIEF